MGKNKYYGVEMDFPKNAAVALDMLKKHYGVEEIKELADLSGISRGTLDTWAIRGETSKPNATTRIKWRKIFSGEKLAPAVRESVAPYSVSSPAPTLSGIDARLARIEQRLDSLLKIRDPKRINQMIDAKAKEKVG